MPERSTSTPPSPPERAPLVSLYCVVLGDIYERYAEQLRTDAWEHFLSDETVSMHFFDGEEGKWPHTSASRYKVALDNWERLTGEYVFQIDADMRILQPVGTEILADGVTVTTHPGHPPDTDRDGWPYCRDPRHRAYVPMGEGRQYHPGSFIGGPRAEFRALAEWVTEAMRLDAEDGLPSPVWYDESYLNRYLIDHPPALVLDKRYLWWEFWGNEKGEAIMMHLDKTPEEFAWRDAQ